MKVKLSVLNRVSLLSFLINKGDFTTLTILEEFRKELSFTQKEHDIIQFQPLPSGKMRMNPLPLKEFEFKKGSVREQLLEGVKTQLRDQEKVRTLELDHLSLYKVLIRGEEEKVEVDEVGAEREKQEARKIVIDEKEK